MEVNEAIIAFSQSEKVKAGLIWVSQSLELLNGLSEIEKKASDRIINALLNMIGQETKLARTLVGNKVWDEIQAYIDKALVMVNSGVSQESQIHLSKALSKTTNVGQASMSFLQEQGLI